MRLALVRDLTDGPERAPTALFHRLTWLAASGLSAPVALVTLCGSEQMVVASAHDPTGRFRTADAMPLDRSLCEHVVRRCAALVLSDAASHPTFRDATAVRSHDVRAYAGVPIVVSGHVVGALCVLDAAPHPWSEAGLRTLGELGAIATAELELRLADRRHRAALAERDERFRLVAQVSLSMIYDRDLRTGALYRSEALLTTFGYDPAAVPIDEQWWLGLVRDEDRAQVADVQRRAARGECPTWSLEYCVRRADGSYATVLERGAALPGDDGRPTRLLGAITDVSGPARAAAELRESERRFRGILETLRAPAMMLDLEGRVTFCNEAFLDVVERTLEEVLGQDHFACCTADPDAERRAFRAAVAAGSLPPHAERALVTRSGALRHVAWDTTLLRDTSGVIVGAASVGQDVTDRRQLEERLRHLAFHDPLTGLANRALFLDRLRHALDRGARGGHSVAVLFLDLDDFKAVNDSFGHAAGDDLLLAVAARLLDAVRAVDTVARFGGDEFAVLVEDAISDDDVTVLAERLAAACRMPFRVAERELIVTSSIGVACGGGGERAEDLLRNADVAMYVAKTRGRGRHAIFQPSMHAAVLTRVTLEASLRRALEPGVLDDPARREFRMVYQPIVELETGRLVAVEALVRWRAPEGDVLPTAFIPIAEETGLIVPLGRWIVQEACRQAAAWSDAGLALSVNVSGRQLADASFVQDVWAALTTAAIDPASLILEITESVLVQSGVDVAERLADLREMGIAVAIDDFGTGYSSLASLQHLPVDILKIDRAFVRALGAGGRDAAIVRAVTALGEALGLRTVAEGVETAEQADRLRAMGCAFAQGYYFSRPLEVRDVAGHFAKAAARDDREAPPASA